MEWTGHLLLWEEWDALCCYNVGHELSHTDSITNLWIQLFERELALLAAVQVAGLEESEGTFTKSLESCNNKVMGSLMLRLEAKALRLKLEAKV